MPAMSFYWHALCLDDTTSLPVRPCLGSLAAAHQLGVCARPSMASLAALFHVASLGSNASHCAAVALSAPLADSMLAVPSASAGAVPTIGSTPPHSLDGQIPSCPSVGVSYHSRSHLCVSMHQGSTSLVSVSAITATPPPCLCTSMHKGSTSLVSASAITAVPPLPLVCAHQCMRGRLPLHTCRRSQLRSPPPICAHQCMRDQFPSHPCQQSQLPLYVSMPKESTSSSLASALVFAPY